MLVLSRIMLVALRCEHIPLYVFYVYVWYQNNGIASLCLVLFFFVKLIKAYLVSKGICSFIFVFIYLRPVSCQVYQQQKQKRRLNEICFSDF